MDVKEIVNNLNIYETNNLPSFINNSIYLYGSNDILNIILYGDKNNDGNTEHYRPERSDRQKRR